MIWKPLLLSAVLAGAALSAGSAAAAPAGGAVAAAPAQSWIVPIQYRGEGRQQDIRPLRDVVEELRSRYGGELISARLEDGARPVYLIRWRMPDGQVRDFRVDAAR
ncbi:MAG: hypothetical protein KJZ75_14495 [Hyphomonadaceae bacterium]|nr:hypothetical protein [Hyphomonadaceae bacterium]GIK50825.1 MAG: hypothetical protein BroJett013_35220 [Alphaproteobacteria bacterium]